MLSMIPALNADCAIYVLSYLNKSSLVAIASTSKAGKAAALPLLVRTIKLYTSRDRHECIISLSHSILSNQLGHYVRHLEIQHGCVAESETNPEFLPAMQPLVDLVAACNNLASLTIPVYANNLFNWAPGLIDAISAHPPSQVFGIGGVSGWDRLFARPFSGLRDLRLTLDATEEELDVFNITAPSAKTLKAVHLNGLQISFKEGNVPCEAVHMVSLHHAATTPMDIHKAFPNVRFINTQWSEVFATPSSQLSSISRYGPEILPNLIGLNGEMDTLKLAPHHNIRMLRLVDYVCWKSELEQVASALRASSLSSLSLDFAFTKDVNEDDQLSDNFVFSWLPQNFSQLKFLDLSMNPRYDGAGFVPLRETWNDKVAACSSACEHVASLQHLKFMVLGFQLFHDLPDLDVLRGTATECLRSLPLVDYFALNLFGEIICVTRRRDLYPGPRRTEFFRQIEESEGCGQIRTSMHKLENGNNNDDIFLIDEDEGRRVMDWYRWEGSDARLVGMREWLESVENFMLPNDHHNPTRCKIPYRV